MQALTPDDVRHHLSDFDDAIELLYFEEGATKTSAMAANVLDCEVGQIAKSLCFLIDGRPILVIASGDGRVDDKKLARYFEVGRKKVKMAKAGQCIELYGYPPGGVPPVGHRDAALPKYLDRSLQRYDKVYAAGGTSSTLFGIGVDALEAITRGVWVDFLRDEPAE